MLTLLLVVICGWWAALALLWLGAKHQAGAWRVWYDPRPHISPDGKAESSPYLIWTKNWQIGGFFKVDHDGVRYLSRWIIWRSDNRRVFLHRIHRPDPDRHMHNHPWIAKCWILWGGYSEIRCHEARICIGGFSRSRTHTFRLGDCNILERSVYHRITSVRPNTWSLVVGGPYFREWSFLIPTPLSDHSDQLMEPMDWREYLKLPPTLRLND